MLDVTTFASDQSSTTLPGTDKTSEADTPLRRGMLFAFSLPAVMQGFMHAPEAQVQGIYAKHAGLSLVALATAVLLTRLFDGITYPLIGYLSDKSFRSSGTRKPWIVAGTIVTITGLWFLYRPPPNVSITYFGVWMLVTYIGWKLTEIPYSAWSIGLSREYVQRARIQLWRGMAQLFGSLVFFIVPYASKALGLSETTELNLQSLTFTAMIIAVCVPAMNLYSLVSVPNGEAAPPPPVSRTRENWRTVAHAVLRNSPLMRLLAAFVPFTLVTGMASGVTYLFVDTYLGLSSQYSGLMLITLPFSLLGLPFWGWMCLRFERHRVWAVSLVLSAIAYAGLAFIPTGEAGLHALMVLNPLAVFCVISVSVAVPAMIGDIADYGRLQSGEDHAGIYSSIFAFLLKSLGGISTALGLGLVGWFGFNAVATQQTEQGVFGIKLIAVWLPVLGLVCSAFIIWSFPINRARQAAIRAEINEREAAALAAGPG